MSFFSLNARLPRSYFRTKTRKYFKEKFRIYYIDAIYNTEFDLFFFLWFVILCYLTKETPYYLTSFHKRNICLIHYEYFFYRLVFFFIAYPKRNLIFIANSIRGIFFSNITFLRFIFKIHSAPEKAEKLRLNSLTF